jgi:uncharacterized delta-60 repeat protein
LPQEAAAALAEAGDLDLTFGGFGLHGLVGIGGTQLTDVGPGDDVAYAVAIQPDGKIVLTGFTGSGNSNFALVRYNADGTVDETFGGDDGIITTDFGGKSDQATALAIQPDGKIVVAGCSGNGNDFAVARYGTDGILDTTFDGDGKVTIGFGSDNECAEALVLQPDGKIVVAGYSSENCSSLPYGYCPDRDFVLARLNPNGSLDPGFDDDGNPRNGTGKVRTGFGEFEGALGVALQRDGKIVAAGFKFNRSSSDFALARYNSNGRLDSTFDGDGKLTTNLGGTGGGGMRGFLVSMEAAEAVAVQSDGKIIAVGSSNAGGNNDFAIVRYNSNGTLDTTFDGDGKTLTGFVSGNSEVANAVTIQPDGKIVVAGVTGASEQRDFALARYNTNGSLDTTFDDDGKTVDDVFLNNDDVAYGLALQPDGKLVTAGSIHRGTYKSFALARYFPDGSLDAGGRLTADFGGDDRANAVAIQLDGKIVVAGLGGNSDFALARFDDDGRLDPSFGGGDGKVTTNFVGGDVANALAIDSGGRIVVVGSANGGRLIALARFNPDGSLDDLFGIGGKVLKNLPSGGGSAEAVAIQSDGKIVVAGAASNGSDVDFALLRYDSNGQPDTTFGGGDGEVTTSFSPGSKDVAFALSLQTNGKIVVAGYTSTGPDTNDFAVARYNSNGTLDTTFGGGDGMVVTDFAGKSDTASDIVLQPNGRIIAGGSVWNSTTLDFGLARYNTNGTLDNTFDGDGKVMTDILGDDQVSSLGLKDDGKIVAAGCASDRFALVRYQSNGTPDTTFSDDGKVATGFGLGGACAGALVVMNSFNRILVVGHAFNGRNHDIALARYWG